MKDTASSIPNGGTELVAFDTPLLENPLGAAYSYTGAHVKALFSTAHPEAVAGSGITCQPPLPLGCITPTQQLENWQWLGNQVNALLGETYVIPTKL